MSFCKVLISSFFLASAALVQDVYGPDHSEVALTLIQAAARVQKPNPEPPRMYVAEGCDGSTATLQHAIEILALHGIDGGDPKVNKELLLHSSIGKMKKLQKEHREKNQTLVFKSILHRDMKLTANKQLLKMGTKAVYVTRKNALDQMVCMIRDCFVNTNKHDTVFGYAVKGNGKPSDLCFKRRSEKSQFEKALLRVVEVVPDGDHNRSFLQENIEKMEGLVTDGYTQLKKAGFQAPKIYYEDIMAFNSGGAKNVELSLHKWHDLLKAWGVSANMNVVRKYLTQHAKNWHPQRQQATIANYKEVAEEIKNLGKDTYLRND